MPPLSPDEQVRRAKELARQRFEQARDDYRSRTRPPPLTAEQKQFLEKIGISAERLNLDDVPEGGIRQGLYFTDDNQLVKNVGSVEFAINSQADIEALSGFNLARNFGTEATDAVRAARGLNADLSRLEEAERRRGTVLGVPVGDLQARRQEFLGRVQSGDLPIPVSQRDAFRRFAGTDAPTIQTDDGRIAQQASFQPPSSLPVQPVPLPVGPSTSPVGQPLPTPLSPGANPFTNLVIPSAPSDPRNRRGGLTDVDPTFREFLQARPTFLNQQTALLDAYGQRSRAAIASAIPELGLSSQFLSGAGRVAADDFSNFTGQAASARGISGPVAPASVSSQIADQTSQRLAPLAAQAGSNNLALAGLAGTPDLSFGVLSSLQRADREFQLSVNAAQQQSAFAQQLTNRFLPQLLG